MPDDTVCTAPRDAFRRAKAVERVARNFEQFKPERIRAVISRCIATDSRHRMALNDWNTSKFSHMSPSSERRIVAELSRNPVAGGPASANEIARKQGDAPTRFIHPFHDDRITSVRFS
ncbi:hypothetical protein [Burkholderia metallica]|uniref:hypothetical protein n=1 Tax=Burkholderia metallica TaxID=488729 RepID=UPI00131CAEA8|nr:hypothetical protein [Burkholderia metallica]